MDQGQFHPEPAQPGPAALLDAVDAAPTPAHVARAARQLRSSREALATIRVRIGILSSYTFDPIEPALFLQGLRSGIGLDAYVTPFGQYEQALIDPGSELARFRPDLILLAVRLQDVCPAVYDGWNGLSPASAGGMIDDWLGRLRDALAAFRARSPAPVLMQDYDLPAHAAKGIAEWAGLDPPTGPDPEEDRSSRAPGGSGSQTGIIRASNGRLRALAGEIGNVHVMDYDALVARHGRLNWQDARLALYARIAVAPRFHWPLAGFYVRHIRALYGLARKVLVLDADYTLWGGVVGDVGRDGIQLGRDFPGNAFVAFQQRVLDLYHRGVILCLASRNEPAVVQDVLDNHPAMVLRANHFAAMRVNWQPKPENLKEMAAELNLGLDSFVFVDDSPVECEMMRQALPQVMSVALPADPAAAVGVIESLDVFDQLTISDEDRRRGELYRAEAGRRALETRSVDLPTFYRALEMRLTVHVDDPAHAARAAQMSARTNQFNMHTIRRSEDDIRGYMASPDWHAVTFALADRFADNGVIALAVVRRGAPAWTLHMLLASCRILGRTVEQAIIRWLARRAQDAGATRLEAEFAPTAKNKPFASFYASCGFQAGSPEGDVQRWILDLATADTTLPDWIEVIEASPTS